jgi:peptidoglycan/LPS O-acetylase OafA/YrhL
VGRHLSSSVTLIIYSMDIIQKPSVETADQPISPQKYLGSLVILRGLAALAVCCCHFGGAFNDEDDPTFVYRIFHDYGKYGVHVFFVVSGFVIPFSLFMGKYHVGHFFTFIKKRLSRLHIPYMAALVMTIILVYAASMAKQGEFSVTILSFIKNALYIEMIPENPVFWTLRVEAQYYVYIGLVFGFLIKFPRISAAILLPATLLLQYIPSLELALWPYLVYFNIGILGFMIYLNVGHKMLNVVAITWLSIFIFIHDVPALIAAISSLLFILFYQSSVPNVLNFLGTISYSLYLIHFPVGIKFINLLRRFVPPSYSPLLFIAAVVLVIGLATIYYRIIEKPAERISKSFRYVPKSKHLNATSD